MLEDRGKKGRKNIQSLSGSLKIVLLMRFRETWRQDKTSQMTTSIKIRAEQ